MIGKQNITSSKRCGYTISVWLKNMVSDLVFGHYNSANPLRSEFCFPVSIESSRVHFGHWFFSPKSLLSVIIVYWLHGAALVHRCSRCMCMCRCRFSGTQVHWFYQVSIFSNASWKMTHMSCFRIVQAKLICISNQGIQAHLKRLSN